MTKQLTLIYRLFARRRLISPIIVSSIGVAISISTLLYAFIQREIHTDDFHAKKNVVYRLLSNDPFTDEKKTLAFIRKDASEYVSANYPEVERVCKITDLSTNGITITYEADSYNNAMVLAVDTTFHKMFDYEFLEASGNDHAGIVLTEKLALNIFGQTAVLGKDLSIQYDTLRVTFTVTGVVATLIENTHLHFDALVPFHAFDKYLRASTTYIELNKNASAKNVESKISNDKEMPSLIGPGKCDYLLQPLSQIYFDKSNVRNFTTARDSNFIETLWIIIAVILFIGSFNFLNLFIISLVDRRKEFGIRKIQGATVFDMRLSIASEVFMYVLLGLVVSLGISLLCLPLLNQVFLTRLEVGYFFKPGIVVAIVVLLALIVLSVSFLLTLYMSRIQPVKLVRDTTIVQAGANKALFTFQFVISLALILSAAAVIKQVQFIEDKPLGFEREIIELRLPKEGRPSDLHTLKTRLEQHSMFNSVSLSSGNPVSGNQQIRFDLDGDEFYSPYFMEGDENLIKTLGLQVIAGTVPSRSTGKDKVVNEKFVRYFNIVVPLGSPVPGGRGEKIIGVVADFNVSSLRQEIPLYMIGYHETPSRLLINYRGTDLTEAILLLQRYWTEVFPNSPAVLSFLGDQLLSKHKDDFQFSYIMITFSLSSIVISCFGLFALAQRSCQNKGKEIAIRKTLGASSRNMIYFLISDFGKWLVLSFVLGAAIGYFGVQRWLETFVYRAGIGWEEFVLTAMIGIFFFLFAVAFQTIKAAKANPIEGLRHE